MVLWNIAWICTGVLLLEFVFGNWVRDDPLQQLRIPRNGSWRYHVDIPTIPSEQRTVVHTRDQWGLRGDYGKPDRIDILTVGGSTAEQRYITDGRTWQDVLAQEFAEHGQNVKIANAGLSGRTTFGHILDFEHWFSRIPTLRPRYVLFYVGINDMFFDVPNSEWDRIEAPKSLKQVIKEKSAIYYLYRTLIGAWFARRYALAHTAIDYPNVNWTDKSIGKDYKYKLAPRLDGYGARLRHLIELTQGLGAKPVFVTQMRGDARYQGDKIVGVVNTRVRITGPWNDTRLGLLDTNNVNGVDLYLILDLFNQVTLDVCRDAKAICIDMAKELPFEIGDFYDHVHNTEKGAERIGKYLYRRLAPTFVTKEAQN